MKSRPLSGDDESPENRRQDFIALMSLILLISAYFLTSTIIDVFVDYALGIEYPVFHVESAAVYGLEVTDSSELTATWNITLLATNPNKQLAVDFDNVLVSVYYGSTKGLMYADDEDDYVLAKKQLSSPFYLSTGNQTRLNFNFGIVRSGIGGGRARSISGKKALNGSVDFGVRLLVEYRYRTDVWGKGSLNNANLYCDQGEFIFSPHTNDTGILTHQLRCD